MCDTAGPHLHIECPHGHEFIVPQADLVEAECPQCGFRVELLDIGFGYLTRIVSTGKPPVPSLAPFRRNTQGVN